MLFAQNFYGFKIHVGNVFIYVTKQSIGVSCRLPIVGERWWKNNQLPDVSCNHFLVPEHHDLDWSQEIPRKLLKK
jgi:hypothetical protein